MRSVDTAAVIIRHELTAAVVGASGSGTNLENLRVRLNHESAEIECLRHQSLIQRLWAERGTR